jgi:hypothetical protein
MPLCVDARTTRLPAPMPAAPALNTEFAMFGFYANPNSEPVAMASKAA